MTGSTPPATALVAGHAAAGAEPAAPHERGDVGDPVTIGAQHEVVGAGAPHRRGDGGLALPGGLRVTGPQRGRVGLHVHLAAGLGVDHGEDPDGRDRLLARVGHLHGDDLMAKRQAAQRRRPAGRRGSRTRRRPGPGRRRSRPRSSRAAARSAPAAGPVAARRVVDTRQRGEDAQARPAGRNPDEVVATGDDDVRCGCRPQREESEGGDGGQDHVALLLLRRAEVEAGRAVGDDPGLQLAIGVGRADVGRQRTGREVPVDAAGVVTRLVGPGPGRFGPGAAGRGQVVAAHEAVEAAGDVQLEAAQDAPPWRRPVDGGRRTGTAGLAGAALRRPPTLGSCRHARRGTPAPGGGMARRPAAARPGALGTASGGDR